MDWPLAITRNSDALRRIVAVMFAMLHGVDRALPLYREAGSEGRARPVARPGPAASRSEAVRASQPDKGNANAAFTLPHRLYHAILLILRPAESALRRLIVIAARGLTLKPRASSQLLPNFPSFAATNASRIPSFALLDPLKHFSLEDFNQNANPHVNFSSSWDPSVFAPSLSQPDEPINAALLFSRMRALRAALSDIPKQARRLARWQAQRDELLTSKRPTRISIFRPGLPPGWRQRSIHDVDDVLRECHGLALHAVNGPDTG